MNAARTILITGFMGSGKTEVARKLARLLHRKMYDLDRVITDSEGASPAKLIADKGEESFRSIESKALQRLLENTEDRVIALGGGAWILATNRELIQKSGGVCIWLNIPFEVCWQRIAASKEDRPLGKTRQQALELFQRRLSIYELADVRLEFIPGETSDELASRTATELVIQKLI